MKNLSLKHYAKALFHVGKQQNVFDQLRADLANVKNTLDINPDLKKYLNNAHVSFSKKQSALKTVFQDFISDKTYNFLNLLIKNKKLNYLPQIINLIKKQHLTEEKIIEVTVETVVPLTDKQLTALEKVLSAKTEKKLLINNIINEKLIGGLKIKVKDQVIDSSIVARLESLKEKINQFQL